MDIKFGNTYTGLEDHQKFAEKYAGYQAVLNYPYKGQPVTILGYSLDHFNTEKPLCSILTTFRKDSSVEESKLFFTYGKQEDHSVIYRSRICNLKASAIFPPSNTKQLPITISPSVKQIKVNLPKEKIDTTPLIYLARVMWIIYKILVLCQDIGKRFSLLEMNRPELDSCGEE